MFLNFKRFIVITIYIFVFICLSVHQQGVHAKSSNLSQLQKEIALLKEKDLADQLKEFLKVTRPNRFIQSEGHLAAKNYIKSYLEKFSKKEQIIIDDFSPNVDQAIDSYKKDFQERVAKNLSKSDPNYIKWQNFTDSMITLLNNNRKSVCSNIVWEKIGNGAKKDEIITLGAHYDTLIVKDKVSFIPVGNGLMPGADNNATGVIALLKLAETINKYELDRTLKIVFLDCEEMGNLGSIEFIKNINESKIKYKGYINVAAIGYDTERSDTSEKSKVGKNGNMRCYTRAASDVASTFDFQLAEQINKVASKANLKVDFEIMQNSFEIGSHTNFWKNSIPAVMYSHNREFDANDNRHYTDNDIYEVLNMKTYDNSFKYITLGVGGLVLQN